MKCYRKHILHNINKSIPGNLIGSSIIYLVIYLVYLPNSFSKVIFSLICTSFKFISIYKLKKRRHIPYYTYFDFMKS